MAASPSGFGVEVTDNLSPSPFNTSFIRVTEAGAYRFKADVLISAGLLGLTALSQAALLLNVSNVIVQTDLIVLPIVTVGDTTTFRLLADTVVNVSGVADFAPILLHNSITPLIYSGGHMTVTKL